MFSGRKALRALTYTSDPLHLFRPRLSAALALSSVQTRTMANANPVVKGAIAGNVTGVTTQDNLAVLNVEEYGSPIPADANAGFPKKEGQSLSYWLQQVRCDPLLDHRSTAELPRESDTVVIGSGVRISQDFNRTLGRKLKLAQDHGHTRNKASSRDLA